MPDSDPYDLGYCIYHPYSGVWRGQDCAICGWPGTEIRVSATLARLTEKEKQMKDDSKWKFCPFCGGELAIAPLFHECGRSDMD